MKHLVLFWVICLSLCAWLPAFTARSIENGGANLELVIHCPNKTIRRGDEIPIVFTITNRGKSSYSYDTRDHDRSGRLMEYKLVAKREDGTTVADPRKYYEGGLGGGLSPGMAYIDPGQSFTKTIALNQWALINKPGRYTVTGTYFYYTEDPNAKRVKGVRRMKEMAVSSPPIEIVVKPRSYWHMGIHISSLLIQLKAIRPSEKWEIVTQREAILTKLAYTCDPRIVPTLIDLMYKNYHNNEVFWAAEAFACYLPRDAKIKNQLIYAATKRGLAKGMCTSLEAFGCSEQKFKEIIAISLASNDLDILTEGVLAAQDHPDDDHMATLIAIATGKHSQKENHRLYRITRDRAICAIAFNRTDEGIRALKRLSEDPDQQIRRTTEDAIREAYRRHREYPKYSDDEYTVAIVPIALDCNDPRQRFMIIHILRSRTEEGVTAVKSLLENPDGDIGMAETDSGVRAIRELLKNPNEDIRRITSDIIKGVYREYRGRPLRDDDFGEEFRESFEQRKKRVLTKLRDG
jgi:hypothetical protein